MNVCINNAKVSDRAAMELNLGTVCHEARICLSGRERERGKKESSVLSMAAVVIQPAGLATL